MLLVSNYDSRLGGLGDGAKTGAANGKQIISKQDSKLKKIGKSNHFGFITCFRSQKWFEALPNGFQNEADVRTKSIQKLIDKWIPICIASGCDF